jgi:hypothetical protein
MITLLAQGAESGSTPQENVRNRLKSAQTPQKRETIMKKLKGSK